MADKMMRVAGRGEDGFPKPLTINERGLDVSDSALLEIETRRERLDQISTGLRSELYYEGVEEETLVEAYSQGNGGVEKKADHIFIEVANNPTLGAVKGVVSDEKADLTNVDWLELDFEMTGTAGYNTYAQLMVSNSKLLNNSDYVLRESIYLENGIAIKRNKVKLNVSSLEGEYYIKVMLRDSSEYVDVPATLSLYGLSKLNKASSKISSTGLAVLNEKGENVQLTAVTDDNGDGVLRTIDAAPVAYDPNRDSLRASTLRRIKKKSMTVTINDMQIGNNDIKINSPLNTLCKVTSITCTVSGVASPASSGTHSLELYDKSVGGTNLLYALTATWYDNLQVGRLGIVQGDEAKDTSFSLLKEIIRDGLYFGDVTDSNNGFVLRYKNDTNAIRTNAGYVVINYIEEEIG